MQDNVLKGRAIPPASSADVRRNAKGNTLLFGQVSLPHLPGGCKFNLPGKNFCMTSNRLGRNFKKGGGKEV
jgi:hypothetical protein